MESIMPYIPGERLINQTYLGFPVAKLCHKESFTECDQFYYSDIKFYNLLNFTL